MAQVPIIGANTATVTLDRLLYTPRPMDAVRAVTRAAIEVPVLYANALFSSDGKLGGYRWGLERKQRLLANEREDSSRGELESD